MGAQIGAPSVRTMLNQPRRHRSPAPSCIKPFRQASPAPSGSSSLLDSREHLLPLAELSPSLPPPPATALSTLAQSPYGVPSPSPLSSSFGSPAFGSPAFGSTAFGSPAFESPLAQSQAHPLGGVPKLSLEPLPLVAETSSHQCERSREEFRAVHGREPARLVEPGRLVDPGRFGCPGAQGDARASRAQRGRSGRRHRRDSGVSSRAMRLVHAAGIGAWTPSTFSRLCNVLKDAPREPLTLQLLLLRRGDNPFELGLIHPSLSGGGLLMQLNQLGLPEERNELLDTLTHADSLAKAATVEAAGATADAGALRSNTRHADPGQLSQLIAAKSTRILWETQVTL